VIQLTPQMRLLLAVEPVDFRKGIDGLVAVCRQRLAADPFSGRSVRLFRTDGAKPLNCWCMMVRVFGWRRNGFRRGAFNGWPSLGQQPTLRLDVPQLADVAVEW